LRLIISTVSFYAYENKKSIIGRRQEMEVLQSALISNEAELIAVYGRRRVGKTYLVRTFFEQESIFEFSGVHNATLTEQLLNFRNTLTNYLDTKLLPETPANWTNASLMNSPAFI
jgi:predicted AAA+ superfamily ATPase